jgi:hypothetical protein
MMRYGIYIAIVLLLTLLLSIVSPTSPAFSIASGAVVSLAVVLIDATVENGRHLRLAWYAFTNHRRHVRVSVSYLFRIRVDDEYLLVKSARYDQFGPVGGVYKYNPSARGSFGSLEVKDDDFLPVDSASRSDLRVRVKGRHLLGFFKWFESGKNREIGGWREFYEELLASGVLPPDVFSTISYDHLKRIYRPLRYSTYAQSKELLVADIFELIPTEPQLDVLRSLRAAGDTRVVLVTEEQIKRRGAVKGQGIHLKIGDHAVWTID